MRSGRRATLALGFSRDVVESLLGSVELIAAVLRVSTHCSHLSKEVEFLRGLCVQVQDHRNGVRSSVRCDFICSLAIELRLVVSTL